MLINIFALEQLQIADLGHDMANVEHHMFLLVATRLAIKE